MMKILVCLSLMLIAAGAVHASNAEPIQPWQYTTVASAGQENQQQAVGQVPPPTGRPEVQVIPELGGVLTPKGKLVIEPSLQFTTSQVNRFTFHGVEILDTFLIGLLEAEDADRDLISLALTGRYGITERLELEVKLPYVFRDDNLTASVPQVETGSEPSSIDRSLSTNGIGDIELGLHYQLNNGLHGWPYFIANLRYKSTTGKGPFDVTRDANGLETELPLGSGFHAFEPSVTMLYPSDPAVFFGNVGYLINLEDDVDKVIGEATVGDVDPGNAFRFSFGMAYSINERASFTLGYKHDVIQATRTEVNGVNTSSSSLDVGALLVGFGFQLNTQLAMNLNLELGVTADAPDVLLTVRVPMGIELD